MDEAKTPPNTHVGLLFGRQPLGFCCVNVNRHREEERDGGGMEGWRGATLCGYLCRAALCAPGSECNSLPPDSGTE